jgi:FkbM family methyltransferase
VSRFLFYSGAGRLFTVNCGLYKIRFFPSALSLTKWLNPLYGNDDEYFLHKILRPNDTVIDVGANIGTVSLASTSLVGEKGRIIAFEPNPRIFKYLIKNIQLNRFNNVTSLNFAVGDRPGEVCFSDQRYDDQNRILPQGEQKVPMTTLDEQVSTIPGRIRLLKVDVEGYEKFVFMGGAETLARTDYIYFEVDNSHFMPLGYTTSELLQMLKRYGFCFYRIDEGGKEIAVDTDFIPEKCMNILGKRITN